MPIFSVNERGDNVRSQALRKPSQWRCRVVVANSSNNKIPYLKTNMEKPIPQVWRHCVHVWSRSSDYSYFLKLDISSNMNWQEVDSRHSKYNLALSKCVFSNDRKYFIRDLSLICKVVRIRDDKSFLKRFWSRWSIILCNVDMPLFFCDYSNATWAWFTLVGFGFSVFSNSP